MPEGPDSNFCIWSAGGYIFGYDEIDTSMEVEQTPEEKKAEKQVDTAAKQEGAQQKKRGRKPKAEQTSAAPAPSVTEDTEAKVAPAEVKEAVPADNREQKEQQPRQQKQKRERIKKANNAQENSEKPAEATAEEPAKQQENQKQPDNQQKKSNKHEQKNQEKQPKQQEPVLEFEGVVEATGVLEIMPDGYGFLRSSDYNYLNSPDDIYLSQYQIKQHALKTGDTVTGEIKPPKAGDKYFPLVRIKYINGRTPEFIRDRIPFDFLTPLFPEEKFNLLGNGHNDMSCRIVDMFTPIGKGQRGLIVAQPKPGKTMLL